MTDFKKVPNAKRKSFFPSISSYYIELENAIYQYAKSMLTGYNGTYLEFYSNENAWYVIGDESGNVILKHPYGNCESKEVPYSDAWILVSFYAINYHVNKYHRKLYTKQVERLIDANYALRDIIIDKGLYAFID